MHEAMADARLRRDVVDARASQPSPREEAGGGLQDALALLLADALVLFGAPGRHGVPLAGLRQEDNVD
jgi:hypothetical protein